MPIRWLRFAVMALCLVAAAASSLYTPKLYASDWLYTVRPGDKLWTLAEKYCGSHTFWQDLAKHNNLEQPTRLTPGMRLNFPLAWLVERPASVDVIYTRGDTRFKRGDEDAKSLTRGDTLFIGDTLTTGADSYANVRFADGSVMQIGPDSELIFDTLSAYGDNGMVDSRVRLNRGSADSIVEEQVGPESVYRISTPLGVAAVRGTQFRTRISDNASFVETVGGAVDYVNDTGATPVGKGFGLKAVPGVKDLMVEELLEPAQLNPRRVYGGNESFEWSGLTGAAYYLVNIYSGPTLSETLAGARVERPEYALASLNPGSYVFGVRGVAASGIQGFEATQPFEIQAPLPAPLGLQTKQSGRKAQVQASWQGVEGATGYQVTLKPAGGGAAIVKTASANNLLVQGLAQGSYDVSVQAQSGEIEGLESDAVEQQVTRRSFWGAGGMLLALLIAI